MKARVRTLFEKATLTCTQIVRQPESRRAGGVGPVRDHAPKCRQLAGNGVRHLEAPLDSLLADRLCCRPRRQPPDSAHVR